MRTDALGHFRIAEAGQIDHTAITVEVEDHQLGGL